MVGGGGLLHLSLAGHSEAGEAGSGADPTPARGPGAKQEAPVECDSRIETKRRPAAQALASERRPAAPAPASALYGISRIR